MEAGFDYEQSIADEYRALYTAATAGLELGAEIRLARVVLAALSENLAANYPHLLRALATLDKLLRTQATVLGGGGGAEEALRDAAEAALEEMREGMDEVPDGTA